MSWQKEVDELERRKTMAQAMGGAEGIARQRQQGKMLVRDRVTAMADPDSFHEFMGLSGWGEYENGELTKFIPKGSVEGTMRVNGRKVVMTAGDFTVRGGSGGRRGGMG